MGAYTKRSSRFGAQDVHGMKQFNLVSGWQRALFDRDTGRPFLWLYGHEFRNFSHFSLSNAHSGFGFPVGLILVRYYND
jgi:hypothetical protein